MLPAEKIRNVFHRLGYNEEYNGNYLLPTPIFMILLKITICISASLCIVYNSNSNDDVTTNRIYLVMATNHINIVLTVLIFAMEYLFIPSNMKNLLRVIGKEFRRFNNGLPKAQMKLLANGQLYQVTSLDTTSKLLHFSGGVFACLPGVVSTYIIYKNGLNNTNIVELPLPIFSWYPKHYDTIYMYIIYYLCQASFFYNLLGLGYCAFGTIVCSFQTLILEMKLFCLNVNDIDIAVSESEDLSVCTEKLREYMRYLIMCHQEIISCVKLVSRCVKVPVTFANQNICFQICAYLFCIAEVDNKFQKMAYFILISTLSVMLLVYCNNGQKVVTAGEELRECLYRCSWLDKPEWFKRDLHVMMAMAEAPLQIKPYGLYVLNLRTFTSIMNASYSYFNLLKTIKK